MVEASPIRDAAACGGCGGSLPGDRLAPATFCPDCGTCLLDLTGKGLGFQPFVPPRVGREGAWSRLQAALVDAPSAASISSRLLYVPFHERAADPRSAGIVLDARAALAPAADLLPAGLPTLRSPRGDDVRGLAIAATAHRGRLADPKGSLDLIREGEAVDVMIPPPEGTHLLYYPLWFLTYRVDHKERCAVVDAATGRPIGPSAPPRRWNAALLASAAGFATFAVVLLIAAPLDRPVLRIVLAAAASWAAAYFTLSWTLTRERAR